MDTMSTPSTDRAPVLALTWDRGTPEPDAVDDTALVLVRDAQWPIAHGALAAVRHGPDGACDPPTGFASTRESPTPITVVICTLGREPRLRATVEAVLAGEHRHLELLVIDNDPVGGRATAILDGIVDPRLRRVEEPRRGLSRARNTGLATARHTLIAFTDDDAQPAPDWLRHLVNAFDADTAAEVACINGLVLPAGLENAVQSLFEEAGGFDKGLEAVFWTKRRGAHPLGARPGPRGAAFPFDAGYGSGNNMAFRVDALRRIGGFDPALGAGSPARGGEDIDVFQSLYLGGATVLYWPAALVRHHHRDTYDALRTQMFGYGTGMSAVIAKRVSSSLLSLLAVLRVLPRALRLLVAPESAKNAGKTATYPSELTRIELLGYLAGAFLYLHGRRCERRYAIGPLGARVGVAPPTARTRTPA